MTRNEENRKQVEEAPKESGVGLRASILDLVGGYRTPSA